MMENSVILNTLSDLNSNKSKERTNALEELTSILKQSPGLIPTKTLAPTCESLIELLDSEHRKYCNLLTMTTDSSAGKLSLGENRLSSAAYVLRLFIEKTCSMFKLKTLRLLLAVLPELMVKEKPRTLLEPVLVHLTFALDALVTSKIFRLKLALHQWVSLVETVCMYLDERFRVSLTDRSTSNFLSILNTLLHIDCVGLSRVSKTVHRTITHYLQQSKNQNANTRLVIGIVNQLVLKTHCFNILDTLALVKETWRQIIAIDVTNNKSIQDELSYLDIYASDFIRNSLPSMVGHEEAETESYKVSLLPICQEYLISRLKGCKPSSLSIDSLKLSSDGIENIDWFELKDFQLKESAEISGWLRIMSVTKLLTSYFECLQYNSSEYHIFKRRKCDPNFSSMVRNSRSITNFICNGLESSNSDLQLICLQMTAFATAMRDIDSDDILSLKEMILQRFENVDLIGWTCLALIPIVTQRSFILVEEDLNRLFKLCIPLIKQPEICAVICALLTVALRHSSCQIADKATLNQISNLYELSDVDGPAVVCNEAFEFWQSLQCYGKDLNLFSIRSISNSLVAWIKAKWSQITVLHEDQNRIYEFIAWLCNKKKVGLVVSSKSRKFRTFRWKGPWRDRYFAWKSQQEPRFFILQLTPNYKSTKEQDSNECLANILVEKVVLNDILYRLLELIGGENDLSSLSRFNWACQVLMLGGYLSGDSNYLSYMMDFKGTVLNILPTMRLTNKESYHDLFLSILTLQVPTVAHLIFQDLPIDKITSNFKLLLLQNDVTPTTGASEFALSFERESDDLRSPLENTITNRFFRSNISLSMEAYLHVVKHKADYNPLNTLEYILTFCNDLDTELFILCLSPIIKWIEVEHMHSQLDDSHLVRFTEILCEHLLQGSYNTSSIAMFYLCSYLDSVRSQWLDNVESPLNADCNDILDWVITRFEDDSFSGRVGIMRLSQLLLHMLRYHDLSRSCVKGGKQRIFATFSRTLQTLDTVNVVDELPSVSQYMANLSSKNQHIMFSEISNLFNPPQQSIEMSALYSLGMFKLSSGSYSNLVQSISSMICFTNFEHTRVYIASAIEKMTSRLGLHDPMELFHICRFDVLSIWLDKIVGHDKALNDLWDIDIFGFKNDSEFINTYAGEISAIYFSRSSNSSSIVKELLSATGRTEKQLFLQNYYQSLPLSFVKGGIGEAIYGVARDLTGSAYLKAENHILLYRWILRFVDLGSIYETSGVLKSVCGSGVMFESLYYSHVNTIRYQNPLHIPLSAGLNLIKQLFQRHYVSKEDVRFLTLWIFRDLENSSLSMERLKCLREMKFILALNEELLSSCEFLPQLLSSFSKYLTDNSLHNEVSDLLIFLLRLSLKSKISLAEALPSLFCQILIFMKKSNNEVSMPLKQIIEQTITSTNSSFKTWGYCNDAIQGKVLSSDIFMNLELLDTDGCNKDIVTLLSLLFEHARRPDRLVFTIQPSVLSAQNLLRFDVPDSLVSENFELWSAYYLEAFNTEKNLSCLERKSRQSRKGDYRKLFVKFGSFEHLFDELLTFQEDTGSEESFHVKFLCASLIAFFIGDYNSNADKAQVITREDFESYKDKCIRMDEQMFFTIHGLPREAPDMRSFLDKYYLHENVSHHEWLVSFDAALIRHLSLSIPQVRVFGSLCEISLKFAENILPILFSLIMYFDHKIGMKWSATLFSHIKQLLCCRDGKKKVNSGLMLVSMLMSGQRHGERYCVAACSGLPLKSIYEAALASDQITFAYMIFELLFMEDLSCLDIKTLRAIYESLDDTDLISGLPTPHTLMGALKSVNKTEPKTWKNFVFSNAILDAGLSENDRSQEIHLLEATEHQGFYGIATCFSREQPLLGGKDYDYKWALQLGNWDLPPPKRVDSKEKGLYCTLKKVSYGASSTSRLLEESIVELVKSKRIFQNEQEWVETITEISLLKRLFDCSGSAEHAAGFLKEVFSLDKKRLEYLDFSDYKSNMQSRYILSQLIANIDERKSSSTPTSMRHCSAVFLANYVELAVANKCPQDALRNAILLDTLLQQAEPTSGLERLRSYVSAIALWEGGDFRTPVMIMKDLLKQKDATSVLHINSHLRPLIELPNDKVQALLIKWTSKSRLETASTIFEKYVDDFETTIKDHESRADVFYILANFLDSQVKRLRKSGEIEERQKRCERGTNESQALEAIYKNAKLPENERKDARRHHNRVRLQLSSDKEILNTLLVQKVQFVWKALHYFMNTLVFTNKYDNDVLDKLCGLWFEYDGDDTVNSLVKKEIGIVPSWKFLPWVNQIASKLSIEDTEFQKPLQLTMKRLLYKLPYDSLYSIISIKLYERHSFTSDSIIPQKIRAAEKILRELQGLDGGDYYRIYVAPVEEFCNMSLEIANTRILQNGKSPKKIHLQNLKLGDFWLRRLPTMEIPLPTKKWPIKSSNDGKTPRPHIVSADKTVEISSTGLSLPKIITFTMSDGNRSKVLMKGSNDDLRQDAIMEQVFQQVNNILQRDKQLRKLDLNISTYTVIPLGPRAGIIEYVTNSISLHQILTGLHKNDPVSFNQARTEMKNVQTKTNNERLRTYLRITEEIKPKLRKFFFDSFPDSHDWFEAKKTYTKGVATTSIVGYILGLGDRHLNNILLDHYNGKPIHIDLGIAFDQGRLLPIPEMVPFRLTRDMVDGFGVTGVNGLFRKSCEYTYSVLRENYEKVMHVLNILKWDPLYSWVMSPVKKHKHLLEGESQDYSSITLGSQSSKLVENEQNQDSYRALKGVEEKLIGNGLSVEATVQELIQQASDPQNLSVIYMGWSPFY